MKTTQLMTKRVNAYRLMNIVWVFALIPFLTKWMGNQSSVPPSVKPTIEQTESFSLSCRNGVNISISPSGYSEVIPGFFISPNYPNFIHLTSIIKGRTDNIVSCADVGKDLMIIVTDTLTRDQCMTSFHVEDKMAPVFTCEDVEVPCGIGLDDNALNEYAGFATDNCTDPVHLELVDYVDSVLTCASPYAYKSTRTYIATDESGNSSSCTFTINFLRPVLSEIIFPDDTTMSCTNFSSDTSVTGQPTWDGFPLTGVCSTWFWWDDTRINMGCDGRYKIRRIWTVMNECDNTVRRDTQNIMSIDTISPSITCPDDITILTSSVDCYANYTFPRPAVSDNCSANSRITISKKLDGVIYNSSTTNLTVGTHIITFIANDNCGNTSECNYNVTVEDHSAPSPACHDIVVGLNNFGEAIVCADSLDFTFFDNCSDEFTLQIRKMQESTFTDCVTFTCEEIGSDNMVVLQVCDEYGNCSTCMFRVTVQDKEPPRIDCPTERISLTCDQLSTFDIKEHIPPISDNCTVVDTLFQLVSNNVVCGEGSVIWRITAIDQSGLTATCNITVVVNNPYDLADLVIDWPDDITLTGCGPNVLDTSLTGYPHISGKYCNPLWIGAILDSTVTEEGCLIVHKTWRVIDSCKYDGLGNGVRESVQTIFSDGGLPPIFTFVPPSVTVDGDNHCQAYVELDTAEAKACATPVSIVNDYNDQGALIRDIFPGGVTIITFTATDTCGRTSTATTTVTVNSRGLLIECHDTIMHCDTYDPSFIPLPILLSSCGDTTLSRTYTENLNLCGAGTVSVHYNISDENGNTAQCNFTITIENDGALTNSDIIWPQSPLAFYECDGSIDPDTIHSFPIITNLSPCARYSINYSDSQGIPVDPDACFSVNRKWTIVDSCHVGSGGTFTFTQHIDIVDSIPPVFGGYNYNDTIYFYVDSVECKGFADLSGLTVSDCKPVTVTNDSQAADADNNSIDASGTYGIGNTVINYTATDSCGNTAAFRLNVYGVDTIPPNWVCPRKRFYELNLDGIDTLYAYQIDTMRAYDNCTAYEDLRFTFDSLNLDNDSILVICTESVDSLRFWYTKVFVFDESGNFTRCVIQLIHYIKPPNGDPDCSHTMMIVGTVYNEQGVPIDKVKLSWDNSGMYQMTGDNGQYWIYDIPPGSDIEVKADKEDTPLNGVSTLDIIELNKYILGKKQINSPYKLLAGDVNNDQQISTRDMIDLQDLIIGNTNQLPSGYVWRFANSEYRFANPENPFNQPEVFKTELQNVVGMVPKANFVGIKNGDINNSAQMGANSEIEIRSKEHLAVEMTTEKLTDNLYEVTLDASGLNEYDGMQFDLKFDPTKMHYKYFTTGDLANFDEKNLGVKNANAGKISLSWNNVNIEKGRNIVKLYFELASETDQLQFGINTDRIPAEAYTKSGEIRPIKLIGNDVKIINNELPAGILYQNTPNPFTHGTSINLMLKEKTYGTLKVYDVTGKELYRLQRDFEKGINTIELRADDLGQPGVYYYQFESKVFSDIKKMIFTL